MPQELTPDAIVAAERAAGEQLRAGALNLMDGTVIGVASTAPAYSLTATLSLLVVIGLWAPSSMIIAFLPMLGVAVGFYWLNRRIQDCGTSYAWIARALHPTLGFFTGWVIVAADVIVMISLAAVAATSTLTLLGLDSSNKVLQLIVGVLWVAILTAIVIRGIRLSAKMQWALLAAEYVVVMGFSLWAIINVYATHPKGSHVFAWNWLLPWQAPGGGPAVLSAVLAGVFIYWGWDTAANVNEETEDASVVPGLATVYSTFVLLVIYVFATSAVVMYLPEGKIAGSSDGLTLMAQTLAGNNRLWYLMVLAIVSSAASSTQTTILPTARVTFSMARDRIIPKAFAWVHPQYLTPWFSTLIMGLVSIIAYVVSLYASGGIGQAITNAILAIGLQIAFYYGLTGIAATWYYRRLLLRSISNFIFAGIFPLAGGLGFFYIFYEAAKTLTVAQFWTGIGAMLIGIPLLIWSMIHNPQFYRRKPEVAGPDEPARPSSPSTAMAE
ncbi:MAG TPA: APC family permease [Chloroflexota bacterium]|nr:APC family permease [Chloroflexota bacterium]